MAEFSLLRPSSSLLHLVLVLLIVLLSLANQLQILMSLGLAFLLHFLIIMAMATIGMHGHRGDPIRCSCPLCVFLECQLCAMFLYDQYFRCFCLKYSSWLEVPEPSAPSSPTVPGPPPTVPEPSAPPPPKVSGPCPPRPPPVTWLMRWHPLDALGSCDGIHEMHLTHVMASIRCTWLMWWHPLDALGSCDGIH